MGQITLQPQENFTIVRQLADHTDTTEYGVLAVVRNAATDDILERINLTAKGDNRFTHVYQVPADISGLGFYIDITTTVYRDETYEEKAEAYGEENETYLVYDRAKHNGGGGMGGGDIDYKKLKKMIDKAVKDAIEPVQKAVAEIEIPKLTEKSYDEHFEQLKTGLMTMCEDIKKAIPEYKKEEVNFEPIMDALRDSFSDMAEAIEKVQVSSDDKPAPVDLSEVLTKLEKIEKDMPDEAVQKLSASFDNISNLFETKYPAMLETANKLLDKLRDAFLYSSGLPEKPKPDESKLPSNRANKLLGNM